MKNKVSGYVRTPVYSPQSMWKKWKCCTVFFFETKGACGIINCIQRRVENKLVPLPKASRLWKKEKRFFCPKSVIILLPKYLLLAISIQSIDCTFSQFGYLILRAVNIAHRHTWNICGAPGNATKQMSGVQGFNSKSNVSLYHKSITFLK